MSTTELCTVVVLGTSASLSMEDVVSALKTNVSLVYFVNFQVVVLLANRFYDTFGNMSCNMVLDTTKIRVYMLPYTFFDVKETHFNALHFKQIRNNNSCYCFYNLA